MLNINTEISYTDRKHACRLLVYKWAKLNMCEKRPFKDAINGQIGLNILE